LEEGGALGGVEFRGGQKFTGVSVEAGDGERAGILTTQSFFDKALQFGVLDEVLWADQRVGDGAGQDAPGRRSAPGIVRRPVAAARPGRQEIETPGSCVDLRNE